MRSCVFFSDLLGCSVLFLALLPAACGGGDAATQPSGAAGAPTTPTTPPPPICRTDDNPWTLGTTPVFFDGNATGVVEHDEPSRGNHLAVDEAGCLYAVAQCGPVCRYTSSRSADGRTFGLTGSFAAPSEFSAEWNVTAGGPGRVHVVCTPTAVGPIHYLSSRDGGDTWTEPLLLVEKANRTAPMLALGKMVWIATFVDLATVRVFRSFDNGPLETADVKFADTTGYINLVRGPADGELFLFVGRSYARSGDGGQTFGPVLDYPLAVSGVSHVRVAAGQGIIGFDGLESFRFDPTTNVFSLLGVPQGHQDWSRVAVVGSPSGAAGALWPEGWGPYRLSLITYAPGSPTWGLPVDLGSIESPPHAVVHPKGSTMAVLYLRPGSSGSEYAVSVWPFP